MSKSNGQQTIEYTDQAGFFELPLARIRPWPGNPRKHIDQDALADLAASIDAKGVLQPILVRPTTVTTTVVKQLAKGVNVTEVAGKEPAYEIAAGERRWRAAELAGLDTIPAIVRELSDRDMIEIAVVE